MDTPITRAEHEEFVKRMEDEDRRQNRRIEILEKSVQQFTSLTASVEKLALNMENMLKEQEAQGNRLEALEDRDSIFYYMKRLIQMRKANEVAVYGDFREYEPENESLYIYERNYEGKKMFVVLNFTENEVPFHMPEGLDAGKAVLVIDNYKGEEALEERMMRPYEAAVYVM